LDYSLTTGEPSVDKIYGHDFLEFLRRNPQANAAMNGVARSASAAMTPAVTAAYEWGQFPVIADFGGGIGTQLVSILDASPFSRGILFDQPHLGAESISHSRMKTIGGNFFESVPTGADAYLLRWILHDWADTEAAAILGSLRRCMKPTARLILIEHIVREGAAFDFGKWTDLQMLICTRGRERTETEYRARSQPRDLDLQEVVATASSLSLLVCKARVAREQTWDPGHTSGCHLAWGPLTSFVVSGIYRS
jgi:O-methyltransferase domain